MKLNFAKMHGLGNDFMVLDALKQGVTLSEARVRELADRRTGIGFDQLLLLEAPKGGQFHANYRIFNADGGEVEQCGNGVRCVARYLANHGVVQDGAVRLGTIAGPVQAELVTQGDVRANMGVPRLEPHDIPFSAGARAMEYDLEVDGRTVKIGAVSMGNPHAILDVPDGIDLVDVFRAPQYVDEVVDQCLTRKFPALWLQEGVVNEPAAERARAAGMLVVMDRCIYKDYLLYLNG